jgi:hypothetical protein
MQSLCRAQRKVVYFSEMRSTVIAILVIGLIYVCIGAIAIDKGEISPILGTAVMLLGLVYTAIALWARFQPFPAALSAVLVFLTLFLARVAIDPASTALGLLFNFIILMLLARAVRQSYLSRLSQKQIDAA